MKIGIDVKTLSMSLAGIGRYTLEMCTNLAKFSDTKLFLYSPSPLIREIPLELFKDHTIRMHHSASKISKQLWMESILPGWAVDDGIDVFWGPAHRLPYLLSPKIPTVVTIHDLVFKLYPETMRFDTCLLDSLYMPRSIKKAHHVFAQSNATKAALLDQYKRASNDVSVVHSAVYSKTHHPVISETSPFYALQGRYILFVGTLEPRKNLERLLKAYSLLADNIKAKTPFVVVGGKGWGDVNLEQIISKHSLVPFVHLLGFVDDQTLESLFAHALFLAMPSVYEGFGLPIIEAMSYGVPVLTSNTSSMPEVAGKAGFFVDPLSIDSIRDGLFDMITNDQLRKGLASHAKSNADRFSWEDSALKARNIFEQIVMKNK